MPAAFGRHERGDNGVVRADYKIQGGKLVVADVETEEGLISRASISGDFFLEPDEALERINSSLIGLPASAGNERIAAAVNGALREDDVLFGITAEGIAVAVRRALGNASSWDDLEFEVIAGPTVSPTLNLALDQVLIDEIAAGRRGPMFRTWEWNAPLLVIGSFQSYDNEVNPEGVARHGITVSRRITGGGAMFMEPGNAITYSLYVPTSLVEGLSYVQAYAYLDEWVMGALAGIGVKARYVPLNDIASEKGKIGGAAQKRFSSGWLLHHVTMSYDIDAVKMLECMRIGKEKLRGKGTASAAKRVDPMRSQTGMSREAIVDAFLAHFSGTYASRSASLTEAELEAARVLEREKFLDPAWVHRVP